MEIQESIIHRVIKAKDTSGSNSVQIKPRDALLNIDERVKKLGCDVLKLYGKLSNGYGILGTDFDTHRFPKFLYDHINHTDSFIDFSRKTISVIAEKMSGQRFTTTSYPIFFKYTNNGREWVLIAVLKLKEGVGIDENTLDLNDSVFFDISNLREAARIDIQKWQSNQQPYLSFIKRGTGNDSESSAYFRSALSCLEYTDAKYNTDVALKALNDYCDHKEFDSARRQLVRSTMYDYCQEKKDNDQPVNVTSLSAMLDDQNPEDFVTFIRENEYEVSETFSPNPSSFKSLMRLSKKFGSISLGFEIDDIYSERVYYDPDRNAIFIKNPPPDLVEEMKKIKGADEVDE